MKPKIVQPDGWKEPRGYANGIVADGSRLLFVAGQIAWNAEQHLVGPGDLVAQFSQALRNVIAVVESAGGKAEHLVKMTVYVVDLGLYRARTRELGEIWQEVCGRRYPAMVLVEVAGLLEPGALIEIEAIAALG